MRYTVPRQRLNEEELSVRVYYQEAKPEKRLDRVICNRCGKQLKVKEGILREGCFRAEYEFDYFSKKDGCIYSFDLCEDCFDAWVEQFRQPPEIREAKEYL